MPLPPDGGRGLFLLLIFGPPVSVCYFEKHRFYIILRKSNFPLKKSVSLRSVFHIWSSCFAALKYLNATYFFICYKILLKKKKRIFNKIFIKQVRLQQFFKSSEVFYSFWTHGGALVLISRVLMLCYNVQRVQHGGG